ncbi:MAG: IS1595 family transposase [Nitrospirales bacterium]|nr:IS1595 family transposase [Nitrospirales bacterium]
MPPVNRNKPVRAESSDSQYSLMEFMREFPDDATCLEWLWQTRYSQDGKHAQCPKCKAKRLFERYETSQQRQAWTCTGCGHHIHPTAGTIFHKSSTSLHLWFYAMYLMTSTRCGISAKQLERELGVTYKTAWRIAFLIRNKLMKQDGQPFTNGKPIELDETYMGGRKRGRNPQGRPAAGSKHKTAVFGMVQRGGRVAAVTVENATTGALLPHILERVMPKSTVYTDTWAAYHSLEARGFKHSRIRHDEKVYVSGDVHTNTIEGFWSLTKRGIGGVYHAVSKKHLQGYLNEYTWRYNHRNDQRAQVRTLLLRAAGR